MHFRDRVFNLRISICNVSLANSVDPDQTVIVWAVWSCSKLFVFMLKSHFLFGPYQLFKKRQKKDSESSYKAMSECLKIPARSTAVVSVVSLFESYSWIMNLHYRPCKLIWPLLTHITNQLPTNSLIGSFNWRWEDNWFVTGELSSFFYFTVIIYIPFV